MSTVGNAERQSLISSLKEILGKLQDTNGLTERIKTSFCPPEPSTVDKSPEEQLDHVFDLLDLIKRTANKTYAILETIEGNIGK